MESQSWRYEAGSGKREVKEDGGLDLGPGSRTRSLCAAFLFRVSPAAGPVSSPKLPRSPSSPSHARQRPLVMKDHHSAIRSSSGAFNLGQSRGLLPRSNIVLGGLPYALFKAYWCPLREL